MQTLFSLVLLVDALIILATMKVLLRTNPMLAISILAVCGLVLALCWFIYPKINK